MRKIETDMNCLLSVIIVNWNVAELLLEAIQSIYAHPPYGEYEIIVVDNASNDDSMDQLRKRFPTVRIVENSQNVGFAKANNQGIEIARGEYILL